MANTYTYSPFNRLTATQTAMYSFDANGNTVARSEGGKRWMYAWDHENRLAVAKDRKTNVRYRYDALGRRVQRVVGYGRENTKFIYDGLDVVADDNSGTLTKYQNGPGIDNKLRVHTGSDVKYFLADHLGSTNGLADSTGSLSASTSYDSFGNPTNANFPSRYQYTGREFDGFTGLQFSRARWYDPKVGRFITEDPIGLATEINEYTYVGGNSINAKDPTGLYEEDVHYYLTYYLAKRNGCLFNSEVRIIAFGDQSVDDVESTAPGYGRIGPNSVFHALNGDAAPGVGSPDLYHAATSPVLRNYEFGRYLHYYQDTFSHEGFSNPRWGHASGLHGVDKTATDVEKSLAMARGTSEQLSDYSMKKCGCKGPEWDSFTDSTVRNFASVPTRFPYLADISGNINEGWGSFLFSSPDALRTKAGILGLSR